MKTLLRLTLSGALTLCLLVGTAAAQVPQWKVDSYTIEFEIYNAGFPVDGTLEGLDAQIRWSPQAPEQSQISGSVQISTLETGIAARDRHLMEEDYFDAEQYPTITLRSESLRATDEGYEGTFLLTIRDVTRRVAIPFTFSPLGNQATFRGEFTIDRLDYGVGSGSWVLGDEVDVVVLIKAEK